MKIIIASSSRVAIPIILELEGSTKHQLSAVITNPDKGTGRGQLVEPNELAAWCQEKKLKVFKPENAKELSQMVSDGGADLAITIAYGHLIPEELLQVTRYGWLNVHFSLLPKWRGAAPVQHSILHGEKLTGITIFKFFVCVPVGTPIFSSFRKRNKYFSKLLSKALGLWADQEDGLNQSCFLANQQK